MPITIGSPRGEAGVDSLYNTEEKVFDDIRANPGEKAFVINCMGKSACHCLTTFAFYNRRLSRPEESS